MSRRFSGQTATKRIYRRKPSRQPFAGPKGVSTQPHFGGTRKRVVSVKVQVGGPPQKLTKGIKRQIRRLVEQGNMAEAERQAAIVGTTPGACMKQGRKP